MRYSNRDAKAYARTYMKGIWAAALNPFTSEYAFDESAFRSNIRHWTKSLAIDGLFISGKQGEFFSMTVEERKRTFEIAVEETKGRAGTIMSCSDQNLDVVIELARHAAACGADYIVVHAPVLHFLTAQDDTLYDYYRYIAERVNIGIALWNHPDSGYLMSPELCARIADIPNIVAIKYSVPREMYARLTQLAGEKIIISTASEAEWFDNIVDLGWQVYLCSNTPYLIQTPSDLRMRKYTDLAIRGEVKLAREIRDSLEPVRKAIRESRPAEKPQAHAKYWQQLLGQHGGPVRRPLLQLTDGEQAEIRRAFAACGMAVGTSSKDVA